MLNKGKTHCANVLKEYLENQLNKSVKLIRDENFYYEDKNLIHMGKFF